jgi:hypothetical protein
MPIPRLLFPASLVRFHGLHEFVVIRLLGPPEFVDRRVNFVDLLSNEFAVQAFEMMTDYPVAMAV